MQSETQSQYFQGGFHTEDAQKVRLRFFLPIKTNNVINSRPHSLSPAPVSSSKQGSHLTFPGFP
jgi:hypothetical protein